MKKSSNPYGELIIDNAGLATTGWSTPLLSQGILRLQSWTISGNARVLTTEGVRVANGDPAQFAGLISSNYLQVGGLLVSKTWVYGDVMDLQASRSNGLVLVTVYCRPQKEYKLLASTNFLDWSPVSTNTPTGSRFDFLDTQTPLFSHRSFRAVMGEQIFDRITLSLTNGLPRLTLKNVQTNHTLVIGASDDLRH